MTVRIINADVFVGLAQLEDESVQCVVTSPPYWRLRDYGTARWEGGSSSCDHISHTIRTGAGMEALGEKYRGGGKKATPEKPIQFTGVCGKCGADRVDHQIGLEPTPEAFVEKMVAVFREVKRVLRSDGVLFLNIGDSYCSTAPGTLGDKLNQRGILAGVSDRRAEGSRKVRPHIPHGMKPKDLVGIPWMTAFALRADGWYLRQEIIWSKLNPMPESVQDRCTKSHEHIFLLSKSARYFYDAEAIKEDSVTDDPRRPYGSPGANAMDPRGVQGMGRLRAPANRKRGEFNGKTNELEGREAFRAFTETRNKRSVWTMATQPYTEAHFATFPQELPETCIKAGSKSGDTILDPFGGAGTTGLVADKLGRDAVLIELNPEYAAMAERRIQSSAPLFAQVETTASEKQLDLEDSLSGNP